MAKILKYKDNVLKVRFHDSYTFKRDWDSDNLYFMTDQADRKPGNTILTVPSYNVMKETINNKINSMQKSAHRDLVGMIQGHDLQSIQHLIDGFNHGQSIQLIDKSGNTTSYNNANAAFGDIIEIHPTNGKIEEAIIDANKHMHLMTSNNLTAQEIKSLEKILEAANKEVDANKSNIATNTAAITTLQSGGNTYELKADATTAHDAATTRMNGIDTKIATNTQAIADNKIISDANKLATDDYWDIKGELVRYNDLKTAHKVTIAHGAWTESGNDLELSLANTNMSKFIVGERVVIKNGSANHSSIYLDDLYNEGHATEQTISVDGKKETIEVTLTDTKIIIHGMTKTSRTYWITNMTGIYLDQLVSSGTAQDSGARSQAAAAQSTANTAKATADANKTQVNTNTHKITALESGKQNKADNNLSTNAKIIVPAINENFNNIASLEHRSTAIEGLKVQDGVDPNPVDLNGMTGGSDKKILVSKKYVDDLIATKTPRTDAEINALIDAKLSALMHVTFDDNTTSNYKIGK